MDYTPRYKAPSNSNVGTKYNPRFFKSQFLNSRCSFRTCPQAHIEQGTRVVWWKENGVSYLFHEECWKEYLKGLPPAPQPQEAPPEHKTEPQTSNPIIEALLNALKDYLPQQTEIDEGRIVELIHEHSVHHSHITLDVDGMTGELTGLVHKDVSAVAETLLIHGNVYIHGGAGGGKTTMAKQIAQLLFETSEGHFEVFQLGKLSPESSIKGFLDGHGNKQEQRFIESIQKPCIIFLDEFDRWPSHLTTLLNSFLANGYIDGRGHDTPIRRNEKCYVLAAGNTTMRGKDEYFPEAIAQEFSTIDRFFFFHIDYDPLLEKGVGDQINIHARPWVTWVQELRTEVMSGKHGKVIATPRASYEGAKMLRYSKGLTVEQIADGLVFKGIDQGTKSKLLAKYPLPQVTRG